MAAGIAAPLRRRSRPGRAGTTRKAATVAALVRLPVLLPHAAGPRPRHGRPSRTALFRLEHEAAHVWLVADGTRTAAGPGGDSRGDRDVSSTSAAWTARTPASAPTSAPLSQRVLSRDGRRRASCSWSSSTAPSHAEPLTAPSVRHARARSRPLRRAGGHRRRPVPRPEPVRRPAGSRRQRAAATSCCSRPTRRSGSPAGGRRARAST